MGLCGFLKFGFLGSGGTCGWEGRRMMVFVVLVFRGRFFI